MYHIFFVYSSINGHSYLFYMLIINKCPQLECSVRTGTLSALFVPVSPGRYSHMVGTQ